jgi:hypothetical protein
MNWSVAHLHNQIMAELLERLVEFNALADKSAGGCSGDQAAQAEAGLLQYGMG